MSNNYLKLTWYRGPFLQIKVNNFVFNWLAGFEPGQEGSWLGFTDTSDLEIGEKSWYIDFCKAWIYFEQYDLTQ